MDRCLINPHSVAHVWITISRPLDPQQVDKCLYCEDERKRRGIVTIELGGSFL